MFRDDITEAAQAEGFNTWEKFMLDYLKVRTVPEFNTYCQKRHKMYYSNETYYRYFNFIRKRVRIRTSIKYEKTQIKWDTLAKNAGFKTFEELLLSNEQSLYSLAKKLEIKASILYKRRQVLMETKGRR